MHITPSLANKLKFSQNAVAHGKKGGSVSSPAKSKATSLSLAKARFERRKKLCLEGKIYLVKSVLGNLVGSEVVCKKFCRLNMIDPFLIQKATLEDLGEFTPSSGSAS